MKWSVIVGSLRADSVNRKLYNAYQKLAGSSHEFVEVAYDQVPLYNQDVQKSGMPAQVEQGAETIRSSDGLLFFCPEYNYSVPGAVKNYIDWLSRVDPQPFAGKPAAILGASPGRVGTARMQYHLRQIAVFLDLRVLNKPEVMVGGAMQLFDEQGALTDETTAEFLKKHLAEFARFCG